MDRYSQFEVKFPFYRMDVNGFFFHVSEAIDFYCKENKIVKPLAKAAVDFVKLEHLQEALKDYSTWDELQNENSGLVQMLIGQCKFQGVIKKPGAKAPKA